MSEGALPWREPLIHLQMLIIVPGGELPRRVPHVVFFNKYSSGTYHVLSAALNSLQISTYLSLITIPWVRGGRDGKPEAHEVQVLPRPPSGQAPQSVERTSHSVCKQRLKHTHITRSVLKYFKVNYRKDTR